MFDVRPTIEKVLRESADIARAHTGKLSSVSTKAGDNNQVLTEADLAIGSHIIACITEMYPDHNIIDEEAGVIDNGSEYTWVVDPIDGTSNFAVGLPSYGTMVGLLKGNEAIAGGIALPAFGEVYIAQKGMGATCNGMPIHVTDVHKLSSTLVAYGIDGHQNNPERTHTEVEVLSRIILGIRNLRTTNSAYDMAQVPAGKYGAYLNQSTKIWDDVALQPIVEEAGGIVTDFWGNPMDYSQPLTRATENYTICVASPTLHAQLQAIIHAA